MMTDKNQDGAEFWEYIARLVASTRIVIDRPVGSMHPRYPELVYPLDYGYLEGTRANDGAGVDLFRGSLPEQKVGALALTVDLCKGDAEIKLLIACTPQEEQVVLDFLNGSGMRAILVQRHLQTGMA
jgi:inorganic pyrophosphatase